MILIRYVSYAFNICMYAKIVKTVSMMTDDSEVIFSVFL